MKYGLVKWFKRVKQLKTMETDGAGYIISKIRKDLCYRFFNLFREKVKMLKQMDRDEERANHYL